MILPSRADIEAAAECIRPIVPPTPQIFWPLLGARTGAEVWVKHENHTPIGAFKIRGGLVYMEALSRREPSIRRVVAATRGNHGQSVALAARGVGLIATIYVPHGNSVEKNAAMRAYGAELIEHGDDFQEALEYAQGQAAQPDTHLMPSFDPFLVSGVATYGLEFLSAVAGLDTVYVPIGLGSGICGVIAAREALGLTTEIVGVVAHNAAAYALSFERGEPVSTNSADTLADGMAVRVPDGHAVAIINAGVERIVRITEDEIAHAMRATFTDTHNVAEGAGAAPLAALLQERGRMQGKRVGLILSGGNVDRTAFAKLLAGGDQ